MNRVVVAVVEDGNGELPATSREAVAMATDVGAALSASVEVAALPADATPEACATGLHSLVGELDPAAVLAPGTDRCTEAMAHLAARLGMPLATNCTAVHPTPPVDHGRNRLLELQEGDFAHDQPRGWGGGSMPWTVTRSRGGGVLLEDAELEAAVTLVTLAPGSVAADGVGVRSMRTVAVPSNDELRARVVDRTSAAGGVTLANAPVVVSGGRGIGSAEGFAVLEELAELLGGAVGCSRVATNNGWRPHSDQVGQTGTKVAPAVYIAAGISGATQHWAGCMGAENILAINTDPEAPMVTRANYAVIGDAQEVLRAVVAELRRRAVSIE